MPCKLLAFASHHMIPSRDRSPAGVDTRSSSSKVKPPIAACQVSSPVVVSPFGISGLGSNFTCNDQRPESAFIRLGNSEACPASVFKLDELPDEFCVCWFAGVGEAMFVARLLPQKQESGTGCPSTIEVCTPCGPPP